MKSYLYLSLFTAVVGWSQTKGQIRVVNSPTFSSAPSSSAFLDASSNVSINNSSTLGKGLLFPRVDLTAFNAFGGPVTGTPTSYPNYYDGLIVYNTASSGVAGAGSTQGTLTPGYWYYENRSGSLNGGTWKPVSPSSSVSSSYTGSASVTLSGNSFQRSALTGDVTAAGNSNVTKVERINGTPVVSTAPALGQVLKFDGTSWAPGTESGGSSYTGSASVTLSGSSFQRSALTGDVTAAANSNVTKVERINGTPIVSTAPALGQVLKFDGTSWAPGADSGGSSYTAGNGLTMSGTEVRLGGALSANTAIDQGNKSMSFSGTGNMGIGTSSPNSSAKLDISSTSQGFLPPRMSATERDNISSPAEGLIVYNTTEKCLNSRISNSWISLCGE